MKKYLLFLWEQRYFLYLTLFTTLIVIGLGIIFLNSSQESPQVSPKPTPTSREIIVNNSPTKNADQSPPSRKRIDTDKNIPPPIPQPSDSQINDAPSPETFNALPKVETYLGHFPYPENLQQKLVKVADFYGREEFLDEEAAVKFKEMQADAKNSGIDLIIISGFRSISQQEELFKKQIKKRGSIEAAARLSAPPGYSEHHTGYALDIGEGEDIDTFLKFEFERTKAYQWLRENADNYGFELSFPKGNFQGVSYEPWHWRYVGSSHALAIFHNSHNQ